MRWTTFEPGDRVRHKQGKFSGVVWRTRAQPSQGEAIWQVYVDTGNGIEWDWDDRIEYDGT